MLESITRLKYFLYSEEEKIEARERFSLCPKNLKNWKKLIEKSLF